MCTTPMRLLEGEEPHYSDDNDDDDDSFLDFFFEGIYLCPGFLCLIISPLFRSL